MIIKDLFKKEIDIFFPRGGGRGKDAAAARGCAERKPASVGGAARFADDRLPDADRFRRKFSR